MTALDAPATEAKPRRRRRRLILPALLVLVVTGIGLAAYFYRQYTSPEYVRSLVLAQLEKVFELPVSMAAADFGFFRGTVLRDVRVGISREDSVNQTPAGERPPLLRIQSLQLKHDPFSLLLGRYRIRSVALDSPVINIEPRPDHPLRNLSLPKSKRKDRRVELPALDLANAQINLLSEDRSPVSLTLSLRGRQGSDGIYDVVWQRPGERSETGRLQIDFERGVLRAGDGGTPWLDVTTIAAAADFGGPEVGNWVQRLGLEGEVRAREFIIPFKSKAASPADQPAPRLALECREAFVSIPVAEAENAVAPADRYLQFKGINAQIQATDHDIRATVSASFQDSPVEVTMAVPAGLYDLKTAATAGFAARAKALDVRFPRPGAGAPKSEARFVELAPRFTRFYDDYNPQGMVDVELSLSRAPGERQPIMLDHALFHASQSAVNTKYFPYPLENVTGFVEFTDTGVYIRDMCGSHKAGQACLNGWLAGTRRCSATTLEIIADNILIDEELFTGLGPKRTWIRERFNPAGRVDATVINYRPQCDPEKPAKWVSEVNVFPQGVFATYNQVPYPIHEITGHIKVLDDEFSLELSGAGGACAAPVIITGRGDVIDRKVSNVDLRIMANAVALDQQLIAALPPETGREVAAFQGQGTIDVDTLVTAGATPDQVVHRTVVSLNDISIQHEGLPLPLREVSGELIIEPEHVRVSNVVGRYGEGRIAATGDLPRASPEGQAAPEELVVGIENLSIDANVHAAVPPALQRALDTWHVGGPLDARIVVSRFPSGQLGFQGDVLFNGNTVQPTFLNDQFHDVHGVLRFDADQVVAKEIEGVYGSAPVIANFVIQNKGGASRGDVKLLAYGLSAGNDLLSLLPQNARETFRRMGASGKVDLQIDRLTYVQKSPEQERLWTVQAGVRFNDVALPAIGGMRRVLGTASISGPIVDAQGGTSLSGDLRLQHVSLFDRDLTDVATPWKLVRSARGEGYLALERITANVYGGQLSGSTEVQFAERTEYNINTVIQGMSLTSFINAGRRTPAEIEARGTVNANLYLTGEAGRLESLRGGGRFEIVEGWLYELPIILAILNVLELTFEPTEAFDEAAAEFYIVGERVSFRDIVVKGGVLALVGEGVLALPDLAVDFRLVNVPGQWWARLPLIEDVMKGTVREFVEIRVSGPITQPSVKTQAIPRITDEVKRLFERRQPKRVISPGS